MPNNTQRQKLVHSPTLKTILMVETTLKKTDASVITIAQLKRELPKQINHNVLRKILEYLEESNKIFVSLKGITWIRNDSIKMKQALKMAYSYPEDFPEK